MMKWINELTSNPKRLLMIDGFGAALSAFMLSVVLVKLESIIGMPREVLYFLAAIPCVFVLYDFICYFFVKENWKPFLRIIAIANLIYCIISIGLLFQHYPKLTNLDLLYFVNEIIILIVLVKIEFKAAAK